MTGRQKIEAALSKEGTQEIPVVIPYQSIYIRDHCSQLSSLPWWQAKSPDLKNQLAWHCDIADRIGQDWFPLAEDYSREERENLSIELRSDDVFLVDKRTNNEERLQEPSVADQKRYQTKISDGFAASQPPMPENIEKINVDIPVPDQSSLEQLKINGRMDLANQFSQRFGEELFPVGYVSSPLWDCLGRWNAEDTMVKSITHPELIKHACERFMKITKHFIQKQALLGVKGIWIEECLTDMINPEGYAMLGVPYISQIVETIRQAGMKSIFYFCGNPQGKWDHILSVGADAISMEESKKDFTLDIEDIVNRIQGRCTVLGNLDSVGVLQNGTDKDLRTEIARQIEAGRKNGNRFIMSLGSPVTPATPVARVLRYSEIAKELGAT